MVLADSSGTSRTGIDSSWGHDIRSLPVKTYIVECDIIIIGGAREWK